MKLINTITAEIHYLDKLTNTQLGKLLVDFNEFNKKSKKLMDAVKKYAIDNNIQDMLYYTIIDTYRNELPDNLPLNVKKQLDKYKNKIAEITKKYAIQKNIKVLKPKRIV